MNAALHIASRSPLAALATGRLHGVVAAGTKLLEQSTRRPSLVGVLAHALHLAY